VIEVWLSGEHEYLSNPIEGVFEKVEEKEF